MDILQNIFFVVFSVFAYYVTLHDFIKIINKSYRYGKMRGLQIAWVKIVIKCLPGYLQDKIKKFPDDDIDIQIAKLNGDVKYEQINALKHLEQILKFIPTPPASRQDAENIKKIQRAIFLVLWNTKTDSRIVKNAIDMLCRNDLLKAECGCEE
jgi:hypothetical protein